MPNSVAARKYFDEGMAIYETDPISARRRFTEATATDPSMADAWLGRIVAGDNDLATLEQLYACGSRLHRETNRLGVALSAPIKAGPHLSITVTEVSHVGIALASALVDARQFVRAAAMLDDAALVEFRENHQWRQYIVAYLFASTMRWPDVIDETNRALPPQAIVMTPLTAGLCALAAHAAAHLGQSRVALGWADRVLLAAGSSVSATVRRGVELPTCVEIDPLEFPLIAADLAYLRGMVHRQLGDQDQAQVWLSRAAVNGVGIASAQRALADADFQLAVTDAEGINSRTDKWDPATECSPANAADRADDGRRTQLLSEGRALLANQIGLAEVKRAVAELEDQIEIRALRLAHGLPVANQTNHMLLVGPPGTGKTTTAEALGKIFAGLGIVRHPEIVEVKRADFCGEHIGASGPKTNELITRSLGRVLFFDELYSLVERHQDGRPDMIGMESVNQLLVALEVHRFDFCFIGAGYEKEVDAFLKVNPGLAGRFNRKLRFHSYTPDELVRIAVRYGEPRATVIDSEARQTLHAVCQALRAHVGADDVNGIDLMQNGRFSRNVIERAERIRDSRIAARYRTDKSSVSRRDLAMLSAEDIRSAAGAACAEKGFCLSL